jgi:hypothetical protein
MDWAHTRGLFRSERCGQSFGVCSSDTFYLGLRGVAPGGKAQEFGGKIDTRKPDQCEAWRRMRDKAKADIEKWNATNRLREVAAAITTEELTQTLEIMRTWANSLRKTEQLKDGSNASTTAAAS